MRISVPLVKRACRASVIIVSLTVALAACGGGGDSGAVSAAAQHAAPPASAVNPHVVPLNATYRGKTYREWAVSFWQWALALPLAPLPHPFNDCSNRPISAGQTGNVWYWSAPTAAPLTCNQSATIIPAGTSIFLSILNVEASSLDAPPFYALKGADQLSIAQSFANDIQDLFCTIDGAPVTNVAAYRTTTDQFAFSAPTPWIFNNTGGKGTSVADGYYLLLEPLSAGPHTIHYGGRFHFPAGVLGPDAVDIPQDITLQIMVGAA